VAEVLARHPETLGVMERFALNHCCGAHLSLAEAAAAAGARVETVVAALAEAAGGRA
jgi:iron-sulfur cluster repair protein YtfE (RIC family)